MRKVVFNISISLDGYFEGLGHNIDWHIVDDDLSAYSLDMLQNTDALIFGRRIYELMSGYWPAVTDENPMAKIFNKTPKLVFSRSLKTVEWENSQLAVGSIADEVARLKKSDSDGLLLVGGSELASAFLEQGLVDEVRFILVPVLLGEGKPVFGDIKRRHGLKLLWTKKFKSGNVILAYEPASR